MKREIIQQPGARRDVLDIFVYLRHKSPQAADRFLAATDRTLVQLASRPGIGGRYETDHPDYADLRLCPVTRFRAYLIVYRATDDRLEVLRVLHAARDIDQILTDALAPPDDPA